MANVLWMDRTSVAYVASFANPPRGTRVRRRMTRRRSRSRGRGILKGVNTLTRSASIWSGSGFIIDDDGYVLTKFNVTEIAYGIILVLEERNVYAFEYVLNVTDYIMGKRPPL